MFGQNQILGPEGGDGSFLKVHSIFETIQGEGPYVGTPSVFIRLSGCNLACSFCDTEFENYSIYKTHHIVDEVLNLVGFTKKLVVITGGEPFRQPISLLCEQLISHGLKIQIETNGTLYRVIPPEVEVVCSPKNSGFGYAAIRRDLIKHVIGVKFLISYSKIEYRDISDVGQKEFGLPVYIQPMDEIDVQKNKMNTILAIDIAKKNNAIISLQIHKILNIA